MDLKILLEKQESHLQKLETLIEALQRSVDELGATPRSEINGGPAGKMERRKEMKEEVFEEEERSVRNERKGVKVAKYKPAWTERFQFLSAVKIGTNVTCLNVLPHEDEEGVSKYVVVGDDQGRIYVFLSHGDVLVDFLTLSSAPVTAMLSYMSVSKNETVLVTGHADGAVLLHRLWEITQAAGGGGHGGTSGEDWHVLAMEHLRTLSIGGEDEGVTLLEVHQVGRMRYILGVNTQGRIHVFRENGTLYGFAESSSRPLAFLKQRLLFLTETGAGSLDLRSMTVRTGECDGLNGSRAVTYVFDAVERFKGYGFTSHGDLIHVVLVGEVLNFDCRVRAKRKSEIDGPLVIQAIKGYLFVGTPENVFVYNITAHPYMRMGGPRPLFYSSLDEIISGFAHGHGHGQGSLPSLNPKDNSDRQPLIACNKDRLVVLGLGDGYVGMYRSNLPIYKAEFNAMLWSTPMLVFLVFLIGAWQFFGKKREAFAIWGADDLFNTTPGRGSIGNGSSSTVAANERVYENVTRPEVRELRDNSLIGSTRRYVSPSGYPSAQPGGYGGAGSAISYRANAVDPNYRTTTEANFRAQTPEPSGYPKRRDARFSNSQGVEDKIH